MARRNDKTATNPVSPPPTVNTYFMGLDIGYGVTKALVYGKEAITFPSVWGYGGEIKFMESEIRQRYAGDMLHDGDVTWFFGKLAMSQLRSGDLRRLRGRTANEEEIGNTARQRLMCVALGKAFPNQKNGDVIHVQIATGLPVDHMRGAAALKQALQGTHLVNTDNTYFVANVTEVMVMPQPYGTIYRHSLTKKGELDPCFIYSRVGVVDIGTFTIDATLDQDNEYIDKQSGSIEAGTYIVQEAVATAYERQFNQKPAYEDVETIMRNRCARAYGEVIDYGDVVMTGVSALRDATLQLISEKWENGARVDCIYVAGGGANFIFNDIKHAYKQSQLVPDPQLSNAQGYLNYALYKANG